MVSKDTTIGQVVADCERQERLLQDKLAAVQRRRQMALELMGGIQQPLRKHNGDVLIHATSATGKPTGLSKAVWSVVQRIAKDRAVLPAEVTNELRAQNFQPQGDKFSTSVYCALIRLEKKRKVVRVEKDGRRMFTMRNGHD